LQSAGKRRPNREAGSDYATHSDFCAIFLQQIDRLYSLALILTGDEASAEKCFLAAFESCAQETLVFKDSAASWSRRSVIKTAIRLMLPAPSDPSRSQSSGNDSNLKPDQNVSLKRVEELPPFDRFVFVMSVLEQYSDRECALLLRCAFTDVLPARIRALHEVSRAEKSYPEHSGEAQPYRVGARPA